jgi:hypothetical protein
MEYSKNKNINFNKEFNQPIIIEDKDKLDIDEDVFPIPISKIEINQNKNKIENQVELEREKEKEIIKEYKNSLNSYLDLSILNKYIEDFSNKKKDILSEKIILFKEKYLNILNKKINDFKNKINSKLSKSRNNIINEFNIFENNLNKAEDRLAINLKYDIKTKMDKIDNYNNITLEEIIKFFDKNNNKENKELENIIYIIKKNLDEEKLKNNLQDIETILLSNIISNKKEFEFELEFKEKLIKNIEISCNVLNKDLEISVLSGSMPMRKSRLNNFCSNPMEMTFKNDITDKLQKIYAIDSLFCAFTTYEGLSYVAWANSNPNLFNNFTVEIFDIMNNRIIKSLDEFNTFYIYTVRHFFDKNLKKDYILTTSVSKTCKVYDCNNFSNILVLKECQNSSFLYSALIIFDDLSPISPFVITSAPNENLNIWDFDTKLIRSINTKEDHTYYLDVFYDNRNYKKDIFIINVNGKNVKLYNYRTGVLFKTFFSGKFDNGILWHMSASVKYINNIPCLFESNGGGNFNIWDIDNGNSLFNLRIKKSCLRGVCIWNDEHVLVAGSDKCLYVIDYLNKKIIGKLTGHKNVVCTVQKIIHPIYGESILTGALDGKIKLYTIEKK